MTEVGKRRGAASHVAAVADAVADLPELGPECGGGLGKEKKGRVWLAGTLQAGTEAAALLLFRENQRFRDALYSPSSGSFANCARSCVTLQTPGGSDNLPVVKPAVFGLWCLLILSRCHGGIVRFCVSL